MYEKSYWYINIWQDSQERWGLQTKARVLSRKVWELLMLLPTNQNMWDGFQSLVSEEVGVVKGSCMGWGWGLGLAAH